MKHIFLFLFLVGFAGVEASIQSDSNVQKKSQNISESRLKNAKTVEELIDDFPTELEIVSCRISIAGKDIKYSENKLPDHNLPDIFSGVHTGHKIFVEYIMVHKKGSEAKPVMFRPLELVVTERTN